VSLEDARRQKSRQLELPLSPKDEVQTVQRSGEASTATNGDERSGTERLMEEVLETRNVEVALKKVVQNKGSPGVDGMRVTELRQHLAENWAAIRSELLTGTYQPKPVKRQQIPKSGGGSESSGSQLRSIG